MLHSAAALFGLRSPNKEVPGNLMCFHGFSSSGSSFLLGFSPGSSDDRNVSTSEFLPLKAQLMGFISHLFVAGLHFNGMLDFPIQKGTFSS